MFRRKVEGLLSAWKEAPGKTPLLIRGLRRSGKKTIAKAFAQSSYRNFCVLDMEAEPSLHRAFAGSLDPEEILSRLSLVRPDVRVTPGDSVLVLGEIQDCARARASLRYFRESGKYDVVATSSFADIGDYNRDSRLSIPVGSERYIHMLPLDFEEFLWAMGHEALSNEIRSSLLSLSPLPELVHEKAEGLYRSFLVAGGMPEAVEGFLHGGYSASQKACRALMDAYKDDFGRYIGKDGKPDMDGVLFAKIRKALASITEQIADEKGAFAYSRIGNGAGRRSFENALDWLEGYGLVYRCNLLERISTPLLAHEDDDVSRKILDDVMSELARDGQNAIMTVLTGEEARARGGFPDADYVLISHKGYEIRDDADGAFIRTELTQKAQHGYSEKFPEMRTSFMITGEGIGKGKITGVHLIDVAPTLAAVMGAGLPDAQGRNLLK